MGALFFLAAMLRLGSPRPLRPAGLALVAAACALRLAAGRSIGAHSNGRRLSEEDMRTDGPYALVRHPLYVSNLLSAWGLLLFSNAPGPGLQAALAACASLHHEILARLEERFLCARFGHAYRRYCRRVPRWPLGIPFRLGSKAFPVPRFAPPWPRPGVMPPGQHAEVSGPVASSSEARKWSMIPDGTPLGLRERPGRPRLMPAAHAVPGGGQPGTWGMAWKRQGKNLVKPVAAALALGLIARCSR